MVSFQAPFLQLNQRKTSLESGGNLKKRKWDHDTTETEEILPYKQWMTPKAISVTTTESVFDIDLHLVTPLPSEWQRCLDIQSGEIHFYNSRTQKRTVRDPRESPEPSSPKDCHMSLDLELNLPCGSHNHNSSPKSLEVSTPKMKKCSSSPTRSLTDLLKSYTAKDDQAVEMVATACMRCHMLVMLQKSSPTCPNCKFVQPPYQNPPDLFNSRLKPILLVNNFNNGSSK